MVTETENRSSECIPFGQSLQALVPLFRYDKRDSPTDRKYQKQARKIEEEKRRAC